MEFSFLFPAALYALLVLPVVAVLSLFLPRARRITVSSLQFWQAEPAATALDRQLRLRRLDLPTLLLLALLACLIFAIAQPVLTRAQSAGPAGLLVLDCTASLEMTDGGAQTRFARQRDALNRFLDDLPLDLPLAVCFLPGDVAPESLEGTADSLRRSLAPPPPHGALTGEETRRELLLLHNRFAAPLFFLTDISPYGGDSPQPDFVRLLAAGGDAVNVGLTRASVALRDGRPYAFLGTFASAKASRSTRLSVRGDGLALNETLSLAPGDATSTLELPLTLPTRIDVSLAVQDDFPPDNSAALDRVTGRMYRIAWFGRPDIALDRLFRILDAQVYELSDPQLALDGQVDVAFFAGTLPPAGFALPVVLLNPPDSTGPLKRTASRGGPGAWQIADSASPLVAHLPKQPLDLASWPVFDIGPNVRKVIAAPNGDSLIVDYSEAGRPRVAVLFDIDRLNTRWTAQPSFVIFWANCLNFLVPRAPTETRWQPSAPLLGATEGRQVQGPPVDQAADARQALLAHRRAVQPVALWFWPILAGAALVLLLVRLRLMR